MNDSSEHPQPFNPAEAKAAGSSGCDPVPDAELRGEFLSAAERSSLGLLCAVTAEVVPAPYRSALFTYLLPRVVRPRRRTDLEVSANQLLGTPKAGAAGSAPLREVLLKIRGRLLLKALVALQYANDQAGLQWLTPPEISVYLKQQFLLPGIYRTNVSTALRGMPAYTDCRSRGRAFEYQINSLGREHVRRELHLARL